MCNSLVCIIITAASYRIPPDQPAIPNTSKTGSVPTPAGPWGVSFIKCDSAAGDLEDIR
jgi:hypothetical protein